MNPNLPHNPNYQNPEAASVYDIDMLEQWRQDESLRLGWLRGDSIERGDSSTDYIGAFKDSVDVELDNFLSSHGVDNSNPEYDALRRLYRENSIDRIRDIDWANSPASRGVDPNDTVSRRDHIDEQIRQWHRGPRTSAATEHGDSERTMDVIRQELDAAREAWAAMQAKRQGRMWDRRIHGYNDARDAYEQLRTEMGQRQLEGTLSDDAATENSKKLAALGFVFDEQQLLRQQTTELVKNTKTGRFVEKFGGWLNKGSGWTTFGKAAVVGLGAGIAGAGVGLLFGAAGAGAIVAGAGAMAAKGALRFTKVYAKSDARLGRGMQQLAETEKTDWLSSMTQYSSSDALTAAENVSRDNFEDAARIEQKKRRKTTTLALGGMALGAGVGAGIGFAIDHIGFSGDVHDRLFDSSPSDHPTPVGEVPEPPLTDGDIEERIEETVRQTEDRLREEYQEKIDVLEERLDELEGEVEAGLPVQPEIVAPVGEIFTFPYGAATEHVLKDVVSGQLGIELDSHSAYLLINHLMEETDGKIFEGLTTQYHEPGNVWIMNPGGETSGFTKEALDAAKEWLVSDRVVGLPSAGV